MTIDNIGGRLAAIVLAGVLAAGGTSLLFGDVIFADAAFTQKHFQTVCIVLATTVGSILAAIAWEKRQVLACAGFVALAAAGTLVIVWYSLGRQTEGQLLSADDHEKAAGERAKLRERLAGEEKTHTAKRTDADAACKKFGPEHRRCLGARAVQGVYADSIAGIEARLRDLKVSPADASAEAFATLAAALGYDAVRAKALALLGMPYLITGLFELGFTMSVHYAFRPRHLAPAKPPIASVSGTWREATVSADGPTNYPGIPDSSDGRDAGGMRTVRREPDSPLPAGCWSQAQTLAYVQAELAAGRTVPMQQVLVGLSGVRKQRISDWLSMWEADRLIPARTQAGRCKVLAAAS